jgi:hypothetical protein
MIDQFLSAIQGRIQDFKLGGAHLKNLRRAEGGGKIFGVSVWKITILIHKMRDMIYSNQKPLVE